MRAAIVVCVGLVLLVLTPGLAAQGCALCKTAADAASQADGGKTLNLAILVLLIPTLSIFLGIVFWAFRYRN